MLEISFGTLIMLVPTFSSRFSVPRDSPELIAPHFMVAPRKAGPKDTRAPTLGHTRHTNLEIHTREHRAEPLLLLETVQLLQCIKLEDRNSGDTHCCLHVYAAKY